MKRNSHKNIYIIPILIIVIAVLIFIRMEPGSNSGFNLLEEFSVEEYIKSIEAGTKTTIGVVSENNFNQMSELIKKLDLTDVDVCMIYPEEFKEIPFKNNLNDTEKEEYELMRFDLLSRQVEEGIIDILYDVDVDDLEKLYDKGLIISLKNQVNKIVNEKPIHEGAYNYFKNISDGEFYFVSPTFSIENYVLINQAFYNTELNEKYLSLNELKDIHNQIRNNFDGKSMTAFTFNTVLDDWDHIYLAFTNLIKTIDMPLVEGGVLFADKRWQVILDDFFSIVKENRFIYGTIGNGLGADWAYSQGCIGIKVTPLYDLHRFYNEYTFMAETDININAFNSSVYLYTAHSDFKDYLYITSDNLSFSANTDKSVIAMLLDKIFSEDFALLLLNESKEKATYSYFNNGNGLPIPCILTPKIKSKYLEKLNSTRVEDIGVIFDGKYVKKIKDNKEDVEILNVLFRTELTPYMDDSIDINKLIDNMRAKYTALKSRLKSTTKQ